MLISRSLPSNGSTCHNMVGFLTGIAIYSSSNFTGGIILKFARGSPDSSLGIATRLWAGRPELVRAVSSPQRPNRLWGPSILLFNGYRGSIPEGRAAVTSACSAEMRNDGAISPLPICLHGMGLNYIIKYRGNFTFTIVTRETGNDNSNRIQKLYRHTCTSL
jgi:hypothetical protein